MILLSAKTITASTSRTAFGYHLVAFVQISLEVFSDDVPWLRRRLEFWAWPRSARLRNAPCLLNGSLFWLVDHLHTIDDQPYLMLGFAARAFMPASAKRPKPIASEVLIEQRTGGKAENDARPYQHQYIPWNDGHGKHCPCQKSEGNNNHMFDVVPVDVGSPLLTSYPQSPLVLRGFL